MEIVKHPHFDHVRGNVYSHRVTGFCYEVKGTDGDFYSLALIPDGTPLYQEPYTTGADVWDVLDEIHALR